VIAVC